MAVYYKPQSPIQSGEDFIYPVTTADQVMVDEDTRLNAVGVYLKNIDNSTDTTVYGNNATTLGGVAAEDYALKTDTAPDSSKLGGVAASDYALKTDTAPDSSKLGGKAPEYYIQPRNLLDNSDFTRPVNQRGQTSYTDATYGIDRWKTNMGVYMNVNVGTDRITLSKANSGGNFCQILPLDLIGKTVTYAVCTSHGVFCKSCVVSDTSVFKQIESKKAYLGVYSENGVTTFQIYFNDSSDVQLDLYWAALYEGAYTAETLPPYVPKGYAAELAECQRYYLPVSDYWNMGVVLTGTGYICLNVPTNIKMRITPNVIISGAKAYHPTYSWFDLTYRGIEWHSLFYRIIFKWPDSIQSSLSDLVLINGVSGLSADL